ncbi:hypothetical protein D3C80_1968310 [compost metagenome]
MPPTGRVMARISSSPQMPAATIASSSEIIMLPLAVLTALTMSWVAASAEARLFSITSFRCLRPSTQAGVSTSLISRSAST